EVCRAHDFPVVDDISFFEAEWEGNRELILEAATELGLPLIVKPVTLGSRIGVSLANDETELIDAIENAFRFDEHLLVEQAITPLIEINCSVMGTAENVEVSLCERPLGKGETLSFEDKYQSDGGGQKGMAAADRIIPADVPDDLTEGIQSLAKQIFKTF